MTAQAISMKTFHHENFNYNVKTLYTILRLIWRASTCLLATVCKFPENRDRGIGNFLLKEEDDCKSEKA